MIKNATFVSEWDGGYAMFKTDCKVNTDTCEVFDIEQVDVSGIDLNSLDYEGIIIDGVEYDVYYNGELQMYFVELN